MLFCYLVALFSLGTLCGSSSSSSSSSSIPSSSSAAVRTRVLSLDTKKNAADATVFYLKEHDLGANETPPQNALCVCTPHNVFYIDMGSGMQESRPNESQMKILEMSFNDFLSDLGACELGTLRNAQGVPYTNVAYIHGIAGSTRMVAEFNDKTVHLFDVNGKEVGTLRSTEGVPYTKAITYINRNRSIREIAGGTRIMVHFEESCRWWLFDVNGKEIVLRDAQGVPYTEVEDIDDAVCGTRIAVKFFNYTFSDSLVEMNGQEVALRNVLGVPYTNVKKMHYVGGTTKIRAMLDEAVAYHIFKMNGQEIVLKNTQGVPYTNVRYIYNFANDTRIAANLDDGIAHLFDETGKEVGILRNAQGVPYAHVAAIGNVVDSTRIVADLNDGVLRLCDVNGKEVGTLSNTQGVVSYTSSRLEISFNGQRVALRNTQGVPYTNVRKVISGGTRVVEVLPDGSVVVFVSLSGNSQKNFGDMTLQKFIFLLAARHGLLQKGFTISGRGSVSLVLLKNWYTELSDDVRFILQHPPYNVVTPLTYSLCDLNNALSIGEAEYTCTNKHYLCSSCKKKLETTRPTESYPPKLRCPFCNDTNIQALPGKERVRFNAPGK